jgi:hypothetical protein
MRDPLLGFGRRSTYPLDCTPDRIQLKADEKATEDRVLLAVLAPGATSALGVTAFADCEEAEEAGGLVSLWGRDGAAVVLPSRMFAEGEAARLVAPVRARIRRARTS